MAVEHEFMALSAQADAAARRTIAHRAERLLLFRTYRAYRSLFLDGDGNPTPAAVTVIADISRRAGLGFVDLPAMGDGELREHAGRRALALHILGRLDLDGSRLRLLASKIREDGQ